MSQSVILADEFALPEEAAKPASAPDLAQEFELPDGKSAVGENVPGRTRPDFIPKQTDYAERESAARARGVAKTSLSEPMLDLPQLPELKGTAEEPLTGMEKAGSAAAGVYNEGAKLVSSFTSPANVAIALTTGGLAKAAQAGSAVARRALVGIGTYFAGAMGKDAIEQIPEAKKTLDNPDASPQEKAAAITAPVLTAGMGVLAALGAVHEVRPDLAKVLADKSPGEAAGILKEESASAPPEQKAVLDDAASKLEESAKAEPPPDLAKEFSPPAELPAGPRDATISTGDGVETPFEEKMIAEWKQQIAAEQSGAPEVGLGAASPKEFQPAEEFTTSLKKSVREEEAAARGETLPEPEEAKAAVKLWDEAKAVVDENPGAADEILSSLKEKPRALNDVEVATLLLKKVDLTNEFNKAHKNLTEGIGTEDSLRSDEQIKASALEGLNRIESAIEGGARETGRGLGAFKLMSDQDFSLAKMLTDMRREKGGRPLTKAEQAEVEGFHEEINRRLEEHLKTVATQRAAKTSRLENQTAELEHRTEVGDMTPKEKGGPVKVGGPTEVAYERAKKLYQEALAKKRLENRNWFEKTTSWIAHLNRVNVLSHLSVLEHLAGAAVENVVTRPVASAFSQLMRLNSTLDSIRQKAVYEGSLDLRSEFKGLTGMLKSSKALWEKLTTGKSDIDWLHKEKIYPKRFLEIVGNVHGAIKEPVRQGIYARSMELRTKAAEAKGLDPAHDEVLAKVLSAEAYRDANMDIFMGDNFLSKALHGVVTGYLRGEKSSPGLAKFTADVLDILFPVVNVSTNIAIRKFRLLAGLPEAGVRIGVAKARGELERGAEKLTEQDAERITRAMKYGAFGAALGIYAWNHPDQFGGIYVSGKQAPRDRKNKLELGEIALPDGGHISHHLAHGPVGGYMNMMADARRLYDSDVKGKKDNQWSAMSDAAFFAMFSGTKDLPAFSNIGRLASPFKSAGQKAGEMLRQMFIAGAVQDVAKAIDPAKGRQTKTFADEIKIGIPKVR